MSTEKRTYPMLSKAVRVMTRTGATNTHAVYTSADDEDSPGLHPLVSVGLPMDVFNDMNQPAEITVTIEPSDQLTKQYEIHTHTNNRKAVRHG